MKTFTIENDSNNITVHGSVKEAEGVSDSGRFGSEVTLARLAANWPAARFVEIYNSLPGVADNAFDNKFVWGRDVYQYFTWSEPNPCGH